MVFNTVCSFVTNTNLQHYSGEQHLSYFSQLGGIVWLQFVTPAAGLCVMLAAVRGLRGDKHLGDFYLDLMRSLVYVFLPLALVVALLFAATGMPMTFEGAAQGEADRRRGHQDDRADDRPRPGGCAGCDQAARHQRRRILRAQLAPTPTRIRRRGAT